MISLRTLPRSVTYYLKKSSQQLHTSTRLPTSKDEAKDSSSSSSSDSSDSDSDREGKKGVDVKPKQDAGESSSPAATTERLNALLYKLTQASKKSGDSKSIDVSIKPKKVRFEKIIDKKAKREEPIEQQLVGAAKEVAKTLKGDSQKTELELLSKVLNLKAPSADETTSSETPKEASESSLGDLLSGMRVDRTAPASNARQEKRMQRAHNVATERYRQPSVAESILYAKSQKKHERNVVSNEPELKLAHPTLGIFKSLPEAQTQDAVQLTTWQAMEEREIRLSTFVTPQNVFQELMQWTDQGKLWRFPINNEQGMEEEEKVHFSEHVFMERHLKDWCPKKGPIRHFMELVCVGLSKNHWLTVEEKVGHITWYKNYFEDKKALLHELGCLDDKALSSQGKKEIEA